MSDPTLAYWPADTDGPELWDITLGDLLDRQAQALPHRLAVVVDEQGGAVSTRWTYAELKSDADALARGLIDWGIGAGDRVAVMAQNCPAWVLLEYALAKVGAVLVTVNPALKPAELAYLLDQGQVAALVFAPGFRGSDIAGDLRALLPDLASVSEGMRPSGGPFPALRRLAVEQLEGDSQYRAFLKAVGGVRDRTITFGEADRFCAPANRQTALLSRRTDR